MSGVSGIFDWSRVINAVDADPISLEPVRGLECCWLLQETPDRLAAYDAWAWLELICRERNALHPVRKTPLTISHRWAIYEACLCAKSPTAAQKMLLAQCASLAVRCSPRRDSSGSVNGVDFSIASPLLHLHVEPLDWHCAPQQSARPKKLELVLSNHVGICVQKTYLQVGLRGQLKCEQQSTT
jgi:hypothetical protein